MYHTSQADKVKIFENVPILHLINTPIIHHSVIELVTSDSTLIDGAVLIDKMNDFCSLLQLNVVETTHFQFSPQDISVVFVLEESHLAIHSWPEKSFLHIDLVTCTKYPTCLDTCHKVLSKLFKTNDIRVLGLDYNSRN